MHSPLTYSIKIFWKAIGQVDLESIIGVALVDRSFSSNTKPSSILVGNADITFSDSARNLGFILSSDMSLDQHITHICRSAYAALRQISTIRQYLTTEAAKKLVCALVLSRLDYVNALLAGCPKHCLDRLQKVQNSAARLVLKAKKRDHVTPLLQILHWLPIEARIQYKLSLLCHNFFSDSSPTYISALLSVYTPARNLRTSNDHRILSVPWVRTKTFGERAFSLRCSQAVELSSSISSQHHIHHFFQKGPEDLPFQTPLLAVVTSCVSLAVRTESPSVMITQLFPPLLPPPTIILSSFFCRIV